MLHPQDVSGTLEYHSNPMPVIVTAYSSRYSLIALGVFIILLGFIAGMFELDMFERPGWYFMCGIAILCGFFTFCMAYLRLFIRCSNCNLELYHLDNHFTAYMHTAKYAISQKIIQCVNCNAIYILDKNKDFDTAKKEAAAMIIKRKQREIALKNASKSNCK